MSLSFKDKHCLYLFDTGKKAIRMKLYTRTVCPKCLLIKSELTQAGIAYELINMDEDLEAKQTIIDAGFLAAPVLEHNGQFEADVKKMMQLIQEQAK